MRILVSKTAEGTLTLILINIRLSWGRETTQCFDPRDGGDEMPTYEYRCAKCGKTFERQERINKHRAGRKRCPKCHSNTVNQVPGTFFAKTSRKS